MKLIYLLYNIYINMLVYIHILYFNTIEIYYIEPYEISVLAIFLLKEKQLYFLTYSYKAVLYYKKLSKRYIQEY